VEESVVGVAEQRAGGGQQAVDGLGAGGGAVDRGASVGVGGVPVPPVAPDPAEGVGVAIVIDSDQVAAARRARRVGGGGRELGGGVRADRPLLAGPGGGAAPGARLGRQAIAR
jgi:hypothetical protein